ncbi:MAG: acyl carrier protein [Planctomycetota bacterium]
MGEASSVEDAVKQMIVERLFLKIKPGDIPDEEPLMEKLDIDSVQLLEIAVGLEEVYGISFEDEEFDIEVFKTVKSIADFVREKTGKS